MSRVKSSSSSSGSSGGKHSRGGTAEAQLLRDAAGTEAVSADGGGPHAEQEEELVERQGTGRITSSGTTVYGHFTEFAAQLSPGDAIIIMHPTTCVQHVHAATHHNHVSFALRGPAYCSVRLCCCVLCAVLTFAGCSKKQKSFAWCCRTSAWASAAASALISSAPPLSSKIQRLLRILCVYVWLRPPVLHLILDNQLDAYDMI